MSLMRSERITFLESLGAERRSLPVVHDAPAAPAPLSEAPGIAAVEASRPLRGKAGFRYRFRYEKTGATALLGHLDMVRELPRIVRRVGVPMIYTGGFHPKPDMSFGPALSLGVLSLDEYADIRLGQELDGPALDQLVTAMTEQSPAGLRFVGAVRLGPTDPVLTRVVSGARYAIAFARSAIERAGQRAEELLAARCAAAMASAHLPFRREVEGIAKILDVRTYLLRAEVGGAEAHRALTRAGLMGDLCALDVDCAITGSGAVKAAEVAAVLAGDGVSAPPHRAVRIELFGEDAAGRFSPLTLSRGGRVAAATAPSAAPL
jgi:radical SAM-linked protein